MTFIMFRKKEYATRAYIPWRVLFLSVLWFTSSKNIKNKDQSTKFNDFLPIQIIKNKNNSRLAHIILEKKNILIDITIRRRML